MVVKDMTKEKKKWRDIYSEMMRNFGTKEVAK